jgi:Ferritin-like domain
MSGLSRRALLGSAALTLLDAAPATAGGLESESAAVRALLGPEDAAAAAYVLAGRTLGEPLLSRIGHRGNQHTRVLRVQLQALTVPPPLRPPHAERNDPRAVRLAAATSRREALAAAIAIERVLLSACTGAAASLSDAGLLQTVATIAGAHAQQLTVLRARAGRPPLP